MQERETLLADFIKHKLLDCVELSNQKKVYQTLSTPANPDQKNLHHCQILPTSDSDSLNVQIRAPFVAFVKAFVDFFVDNRYIKSSLQDLAWLISKVQNFLNKLSLCKDMRENKAALRNSIKVTKGFKIKENRKVVIICEKKSNE